MNKYSKYIALAIVLVVVILLFGSFGRNGASNVTRVTKIGLIAPLSGPAGVTGEEFVNAANMASSTTVSLITEDDQCSGKNAVSAYQKLVLQDVHIFMVGCSGSVMALAPLAKTDGNLIVTGYAGSSEIRKTGDEVIRFIPDALAVAGPMGNFIANLPVSAKTGLLYEQQDYAKSVAMALQEKLGSRIVTSETYSADDSTFRTQITKLKSAKIDTLIYIPTGEKAAKIIYGEMKTLGYAPYVVGDVNACGFSFSPADYGMKMTCFDAGFVNETQAYKDFKTNFKALYGIESAFPFYDAVSVDIIKIIDKYETSAGSKVTISDLKKYILAGVQGDMSYYTFTANGEVVADQYLKKVEK